MNNKASLLLTLLFVHSAAGAADDPVADIQRDILITFENDGASPIGSGVSAPYRNRVRYSIAAAARKSASDIADQFSLTEIDHWPIRSLSVYCFVYRIPDGTNRDEIIDLLKGDDRIESVQPLQEFETGTTGGVEYNDTLVNLQHGLDALNIAAAHQHSTGRGVRIAIIDSDVDAEHEDLIGRIRRVRVFSDPGKTSDIDHGTAVASVIGANANNSAGIVGIAPYAIIDLFVSCWSEEDAESAVCDSFTLAKAFDAMLEDPPQILNLSLSGPDDALIGRLIDKTAEAGVIIVAASPINADSSNHFPAHLDHVIGVGQSEQKLLASNVNTWPARQPDRLFAPGNQIMVAVPKNAYDFRSGSSLAAAHVTGVVALLLVDNPGLPFDIVMKILKASEAVTGSGATSINACNALQILNNELSCI